MVRRVYAHLGTVRHRSEVVEYRVEQHEKALKDRLGALGFVTRIDTAEERMTDNEMPHREITHDGAEISGAADERARRDSNARPLAPEASALSS